MKTNFQKGFIIPALIALVVVVIAGGIFYWKSSRGGIAPDRIEDLSTIPEEGDSQVNVIQNNKPVNNNPVAPVSSKPSITVLSPNGGETIRVGGVYNITWNSLNLGTSTVSLRLNDESKVCPVGIVGCQNGYIIDYGVKNTGTYSWDTTKKMGGSSTGPNSVSVIPGTKYKVLILADNYSEGRGIADESNGYFTIIPASVQSVVSGTNTDISASNWKTYRNTKRGWEIKYPSDWSVKDESSESNYGLMVYISSPLSKNSNLLHLEELPTQYTIRINMTPPSNTPTEPASISVIAGFGSPGTARNKLDGMPWNLSASVSEATQKATNEYKIAQQIVYSFLQSWGSSGKAIWSLY